MDVSLEIEFELGDDAEAVGDAEPIELSEPEALKEPQPGVRFMSAGVRTCRTIIGSDDEGVLFCEGVAPVGQSWCPACRKRYFVKPVRFARKRPAIRSALLMATE
jgi:hypothetical protein